MGVINSGSFAKALWPGVKTWFGGMYKEITPEYPDFFERDSSEMNYEEEVAIDGFGLANVLPEGSSVSYDAMSQFYVKRYTHVEVGLGFQITRIAIEDNQYPKLAKQRSKMLAFSMRQSKEIIAANVFDRAFTAAYAGGDGKEMVATDHPIVGGTFSNEANPAADLSGLALEQACVDIAGFVNNRGLRISVKPKALVVSARSLDFFEAQRILKSALEYDTANNAINALKSTNQFPEGIKSSHYYTDTDSWFILTDCPDGLKFFQRRALELPPGEVDYDTGNIRFKSTERYSFGWTDPRGVYGSAGV